MAALDLQSVLNLSGLALLTASALGAAVAVAGELRQRQLRSSRLQPAGSAHAAGPSVSGSALLAPALGGLRRLGQQAAVRDPEKVSQARMRLMRAGFFSREAAIIYLGARAAALVVATLGTLLVIPLNMGGHGKPALAVALALAAAAVLGPDQFLSMRQKNREREYSDGFPDLLDLLVASVEAGLSLDAGVSRVTDELARAYPRLTLHLRLLTLELRAGKSRKDAWSSFADRLGIDDARALATMLRQAEDMGTSLGETLGIFSADMRSKRMLRAEEKAMALPAKLTVPLILFIFPCLLGVLILPAAWRISHIMGGG